MLLWVNGWWVKNGHLLNTANLDKTLIYDTPFNAIHEKIDIDK